jgi:hypothetical protein
MTLKERERLAVAAVEELQQLDQAERALRDGDTAGAAQALAEARQQRVGSTPPIPVAIAAKLLKVSEPTIRSWLTGGILEDAGAKPRGATLESVVRIHALLAELREAGQDRNVRATLLARLDDELTLHDERLARSIRGMRGGRGKRLIVAGSNS